MPDEAKKRTLDNYASQIGHNRGPVFLEHESNIFEGAKSRPHVKSEIQRIKILFDMMRSHVNGDYLLPDTTAAYVAAGLSVVAAETGIFLPIAPVPTLILDASIVAMLYVTLREEISGYIEWRLKKEPEYAEMRKLIG